MAQDPIQALRDYIERHGLKTSRQRERIAKVFFEAGGHLSVEELLARVRLGDERVGQATVYRTMKLLTTSGLAEARHFGDGHTRYEAMTERAEHHDHLICESCGAIVEFHNEHIEGLQAKVAKAHGYVISHHKMELYGICGACQRQAGAKKGSAR